MFSGRSSLFSRGGSLVSGSQSRFSPRTSFKNFDEKFLIPRFCRADLGWIFSFGLANFRWKFAGKLFSEFSQQMFSRNCSALSLSRQAPKIFTPKIHVQKQPAFLSNVTFWDGTQHFFTTIFCLRLEEGKGPPPPRQDSASRPVLRTPGRFTTRPLPMYSITKMSVVRPFSVLSKDDIGPQ